MCTLKVNKYYVNACMRLESVTNIYMWICINPLLGVALIMKKPRYSELGLEEEKKSKWILFAVDISESYTKFRLRYALVPWRVICMTILVNSSYIFFLGSL